jgi:hypothetical protein
VSSATASRSGSVSGRAFLRSRLRTIRARLCPTRPWPSA